MNRRLLALPLAAAALLATAPAASANEAEWLIRLVTGVGNSKVQDYCTYVDTNGDGAYDSRYCAPAGGQPVQVGYLLPDMG